MKNSSMNNDANTLGMRRNEMDASLASIFLHTNPDIARDINNKVFAFVNQIENERRIMKEELAAFKKNNEELIQRHNAAISSWDEERERALREADRVKEWKQKYEYLEEYMRFIGKQIPCNTGGTFENDPIDAILDAAVRVLNAERLKQKYNEEANEKTLESLRYNVERTKVFEEVADMLYNAGHDQMDAAKKICEIVREHYPIGSYSPER